MSYLSDWAEQVINRDNNCVLCGSKHDLEAHHVFKVNEYDDAYLDLNNGITLCNKCHLLYHEKYGLNCSLKNLLEFKSDVFNPSLAKLKKKYEFVKNQIKILENQKDNAHIQIKNLEKKNQKLKKKNKKLRKRLKEYQ